MFRLIVSICFVFFLGDSMAYTQSNTIEKKLAYLKSEIKKKPRDTAIIKKLIDTTVYISEQNVANNYNLILNDLLELSLKSQYDLGAMNAYSNIVTNYNNKGLYNEAFQLMKHIFTTEKGWHLPSFKVAVLNSLGNYFQRNGQYDSASHYYFEALTVLENAPNINPNFMYVIYGNLSGIFEHTEEYEKGLHYLIKAENEVRAKDNKYYLTLILINKGNAFLNLEKIPESIVSLNEAIEIAKKFKYDQWLHLALGDISKAYLILKDNKKALKYLKEADLIKGNIDPVYQASNWSIMGDIYYDEKNYNLAEYYWQKTLQFSQKHNISKTILYAHKMLGALYHQSQQNDLAYYHSNAYNTLRDSIFREEVLARTSTLDKKYQTAQKDKEIAENKLDINRKQHQIQNRNQWIAIVTTAILFLAMLTAFLYSRFINSKNKQQAQEEQLKRIESEQEVLQLKSMIKGEEKTRIQISRNLHDAIGGQMASLIMHLSQIKSKYAKGGNVQTDMKKLSDILVDTAKEVRQSAHNLMPDILTRKGLKEVLLQYCESNSREGLKLELLFDDAIQLNKNAELFLYRIIQELTQNILKHSKANHAVIQLMAIDTILALTVEDNGIGFIQNKETSNGQGLNSIRNRIENLNGFISTDAAPNMGTTIHIELEFSKLQQLSE